MKYYKIIDGNWSYFTINKIYREDSKGDEQMCVLPLSTFISEYKGCLKEVSEKEYLQQELDNGKLVKGAIYTVKDSGVIFKDDGTKHSEYHIGFDLDGKRTFCKDYGNFDTDNVKDGYRLATEEEVAWIEDCRYNDGLIEYDKFIQVYNHYGFKVGDRVIIKGKPKSWSHKLNKNCPLAPWKGEVSYPYECTIEGLENSELFVSMTCGKWGWCLDTLVEDNLIEKIENMERKIKAYKLVKPKYEIAAAKILSSGNSLYGMIGAPIDIEKLKEAGVLDLWFEPVYEEEKIELLGYNVSINDTDVSIGCTSYQHSSVKLINNVLQNYGERLMKEKSTIQKIVDKINSKEKERLLKTPYKSKTTVSSSDDIDIFKGDGNVELADILYSIVNHKDYDKIPGNTKNDKAENIGKLVYRTWCK
jgi:hypothetical protein